METNSENEPSLYERFGGEPAIDRLIDGFYERVLADDELAPFFTHVPMEKLRSMQRLFFAAALGGDVGYSGRSLAHAHHGRGIKPSHLGRFIEHLRGTLEGHELSDQDRTDIIDRINTFADEIVGGGGLDA